MYRRAQPVQPDSAGRHARVAPHQTSYCSGTVGWQVNSADQHQLPHSVCHWTSGCGMTQEVFLVTRFDWGRNNHDFVVAPTSRFCVSCTELMENKRKQKRKTSVIEQSVHQGFNYFPKTGDIPKIEHDFWGHFETFRSVMEEWQSDIPHLLYSPSGKKFKSSHSKFWYDFFPRVNRVS